VNIGTEEEIKIKDLAILIKEIVGFDGKTLHDLSKPDGMPRKLSDISRIKALGMEAQDGPERRNKEDLRMVCRE
jgi:GDP-L-fucose synthase